MDEFYQSCDDYLAYPKNIIHHDVHNPTAYYTRLFNERHRMFVNEGQSALDFLDLDSQKAKTLTRTTFQSQRVANLGDLREHLREALNIEKDDPLCRFIFIHARHSRARLRISHSMICFLFSYLQVMPSFLDFVFPFGDQEHAQDFYFTGFKEECLLPKLGAEVQGPLLHELGRSDSVMQLCFNLRSVEESPNEVGLPWSIRQTAIYHSFDFGSAKSVWVTVKGNNDIKKRISELVKPWDSSTCDSVSNAFKATFKIHLLLCYWAVENWRWYINDLERSVHSSTQMALSAVIERPPSPPHQPTIPPASMSPPNSPRSHSGTFSGLSRVSTTLSMLSPRVKSRDFFASPTPPSRKYSNISQAQTATDGSLHYGSSVGNIKLGQGTFREATKVFLQLLRRVKNWRPTKNNSNSSCEKLNLPLVQGIRKEPDTLPSGLEDEDGPHPSGKFAFSDLQNILYVEQKAQEGAVMLQLNLGVLEELRQHYVYVATHPDCPPGIKNDCDISRFEKSIRGIEKELRLQHQRFETFSRLLSDHKVLLNSILQYRGMEASTTFSKKAHESAVKMEALTSNMNDIAQKTRQETVSMRIITLVTLFFLPGTFIGTFFSTDIIKFEPGNVEHFQPQGLKLFLAICLPLMVVTFVAWYFVYRSVDQGQKRKDTEAANRGYAHDLSSCGYANNV